MSQKIGIKWLKNSDHDQYFEKVSSTKWVEFKNSIKIAEYNEISLQDEIVILKKSDGIFYKLTESKGFWSSIESSIINYLSEGKWKKNSQLENQSQVRPVPPSQNNPIPRPPQPNPIPSRTQSYTVANQAIKPQGPAGGANNLPSSDTTGRLPQPNLVPSRKQNYTITNQAPAHSQTNSKKKNYTVTPSRSHNNPVPRIQINQAARPQAYTAPSRPNNNPVARVQVNPTRNYSSSSKPQANPTTSYQSLLNELLKPDSSDINGNSEHTNGNVDYGNNNYEYGVYGNVDYGYGNYGNGDFGYGDYGNVDYGNNDYGNVDYGNNNYGFGDYGNGDFGFGEYGNGDFGFGDFGYGDY